MSSKQRLIAACELAIDNLGDQQVIDEIQEAIDSAKEPIRNGVLPYGLRRDEHRRIVKDVDELATIVTITTRWKAGDSLHAIKRWLNGTGLRNRSGGLWHHYQVKRILESQGLI